MRTIMENTVGFRPNSMILADLFVEYINAMSNAIQCGNNVLKNLESSELYGLTGPEIWELSSKKISLEQIKFDVKVLKKEALGE